MKKMTHCWGINPSTKICNTASLSKYTAVLPMGYNTPLLILKVRPWPYFQEFTVLCSVLNYEENEYTGSMC